MFWKTWLSKLGCHGSINVDVHFTTTLKCSQINFRKIRFNGFEVSQL